MKLQDILINEGFLIHYPIFLVLEKVFLIVLLISTATFLFQINFKDKQLTRSSLQFLGLAASAFLLVILTKNPFAIPYWKYVSTVEYRYYINVIKSAKPDIVQNLNGEEAAAFHECLSRSDALLPKNKTDIIKNPFLKCLNDKKVIYVDFNERSSQ